MASAHSTTIFALATASGRAGVAVIRVSGPSAGGALERIAGSKPAARSATYRTFRHPGTGDVLDRGLVLWFPAPRSFTGEDVVEFHLHGGRAVSKAVLDAIGSIVGLRNAEPGEFTRRAFDNGKIDLAEAEGLADLIEAETEAQRRHALATSSGALSAVYESWRTRLIEATALVEASIDFSDEGDVSAKAVAKARDIVAALQKELRSYLADGHRGEILRDGFRVVLAGLPNVGKSSLLNALARRDAAIVSEEAGTTRDVIEVHLDLEGYPVVVSDTAGMRQTVVKVEREGIRRSVAAARTADLVIWLMDGHSADATFPKELEDLGERTMAVVSKADLLPASRLKALPPNLPAISVMTGHGMAGMIKTIASMAAEGIGGGQNVITSTRQRSLVANANQALDAFLNGSSGAPELRAEDLRAAAAAVGRLTGRVDVEDVLDQIFKRFCIGK
jgi:tRNA modification GTPase